MPDVVVTANLTREPTGAWILDIDRITRDANSVERIERVSHSAFSDTSGNDDPIVVSVSADVANDANIPGHR